jgi:hypothetical protein
VSVLRAAHKIVAADPDWTAWRIEGLGRGWVFFNHANVQSYALARMIGDMGNIYLSPKHARRRMGYWLAAGYGYEHLLSDRAKLLAELAPGGRHHDAVTPPNGGWVKHVEKHIATRDGDTARVAVLQAEHEAWMAAWLASFPGRRGASPSVALPDTEIGRETFNMLAEILDTLADDAREGADQNDLDAQRARLSRMVPLRQGAHRAQRNPPLF